MELYTLKINVTNQRLSFGENPPEIFSGDQSIDFVEFTFTDDSWNFPNIWAIFSRQKGASYQIALDENKVMIPAEVMQKRGYVYIGLMATYGENVQTSSVLQYSIRQGAANVDTIAPSPNIYEQFLTDLDAYQEAIHNLQTLAATAETLPAGSDATALFDNGVLELGIPKGDTGATGNGIQSITKTSTSGSVDTYTITFTNGSTTTFNVTNGEVTQAELDSVIEPLEEDISDLKDIAELEKKDILSESEYVQIYIKADGTYVGSTAWRSYAQLVSNIDDSFYKYEFYGYTNTIGFYAVAFYDNENFTAGNFIGGLQYTSVGGNSFVIRKEDIPLNAKVILFLTRTASASDQTLYKCVSGLKAQIEELSEEVNKNPYVNSSINQIARLGWMPYSSSTPPEQSIESYKLAYENGCRIMLCDVRVTSDGQYVLWHDATLNNTVKHSDGTNLSASELSKTIEDSTLAELNVYDYGIYKGSQYAGMKIPMLNDFLAWCGLVNCAPMLEMKVELASAQCAEVANMCKMYGLGESVIIDEYTTVINNTMASWIANLPKATISIIGGSAINLVIPKAQQIINAGLNALVVLSSSAQLSGIQDAYGNLDYNKVQSVTNIGADLVYTEIQTSTELTNFYNDGYLAIFKYVASSYLDINKWIHGKLISN